MALENEVNFIAMLVVLWNLREEAKIDERKHFCEFLTFVIKGEKGGKWRAVRRKKGKE